MLARLGLPEPASGKGLSRIPAPSQRNDRDRQVLVGLRSQCHWDGPSMVLGDEAEEEGERLTRCWMSGR
jgi:hypothetical protein